MLVSYMDAKKEYLYHYTSLEALACILESKTIKLNALNKMDDREESMCKDITEGGKYCFVSSWTDEAEESIPMWNMYSGMNGIRMGVEKNPFMKYKFADPLLPEQTINSYISLNELEDKKLFPYFPEEEKILHRVYYTEEEQLLFPTLKKSVETGYHIEYERLGKYKRTVWRFQKEWRYIIYIRPVDLNSYLESVEKGQLIYKRNIEAEADLMVDAIYLKLKPESLKNMEILCGPKMSKGDRILLDCLMEKYGSKDSIRESSLKIR